MDAVVIAVLVQRSGADSVVLWCVDDDSAGDESGQVGSAPGGVEHGGDDAWRAVGDLVGEAQGRARLLFPVRTLFRGPVAGAVGVQDDPTVSSLRQAYGEGDGLLSVDGPVATLDLDSSVRIYSAPPHLAGLLVAGELLGLVRRGSDDGGVAVDHLATVRVQPAAAGSLLRQVAESDRLFDPGVPGGFTELRESVERFVPVLQPVMTLRAGFGGEGVGLLVAQAPAYSFADDFPDRLVLEVGFGGAPSWAVLKTEMAQT
ncbi:hypothetical protein [Streptomyces sp. NPDC002490]|uniref:hypothetical protein n=1 Tax=Streptomyces sp. NPDC002490 TaxID=3154416 RepID=UPI00332AA0D9